jgi:hypothetical protein
VTFTNSPALNSQNDVYFEFYQSKLFYTLRFVFIARRFVFCLPYLALFGLNLLDLGP